jgi:GNAT superfamily N-acetyltransferase
MNANLSEFEIRSTLLQDAADIASVHINAWREAYQGLIPQTYLDELHYTYQARKQMWHRFIAEERGRCLYVAEHRQFGIVGFSSVSHPRDERYQSWGELTCIYLLKRYHRLGIGRKLLQAAFDCLKEEGFSKAYCWVLENNPTIGFYQKTGAVVSSTGKTDIIGGLEVKELAIEWPSLEPTMPGPIVR